MVAASCAPVLVTTRSGTAAPLLEDEVSPGEADVRNVELASPPPAGALTESAAGVVVAARPTGFETVRSATGGGFATALSAAADPGAAAASVALPAESAAMTEGAGADAAPADRFTAVAAACVVAEFDVNAGGGCSDAIGAGAVSFAAAASAATTADASAAAAADFAASPD
jgi:hypothetical protein